jgi:hypothetical protein
MSNNNYYPYTKGRDLPDNPRADRAETVRVAAQVDGQIEALDQMVRTASATCCADCYWSSVLKPLARPLLGRRRGYLPRSVTEGPAQWQLLSEMSKAAPPPRVPAAGPTEEWLRREDVWDAITDHWLSILRARAAVQS